MAKLPTTTRQFRSPGPVGVVEPRGQLSKAQTMNVLGQVADTAGEHFFKIAAVKAEEKAEMDASNLVLQRDEDGNIVPPELPEDTLIPNIYSEKYKQNVLSTYVDQVGIDARKNAATVANNNRLNPGQFQAEYNEYVQTTLQNVMPGARSMVDAELAKVGVQHFNYISEQKAEFDWNEQKRVSNEVINEQAKDLYDMIMQGKSQSLINEQEKKIKAQINRAREGNLIDDAGRDEALDQLRITSVAAALGRDFTNLRVTSAEGVNRMLDMRDSIITGNYMLKKGDGKTVKLSDEYDIDERTAIAERITAVASMKKAHFDRQTEAYNDRLRVATFRSIQQAMLQGHTLSVSDLEAIHGTARDADQVAIIMAAAATSKTQAGYHARLRDMNIANASAWDILRDELIATKDDGLIRDVLGGTLESYDAAFALMNSPNSQVSDRMLATATLKAMQDRFNTYADNSKITPAMQKQLNSMVSGIELVEAAKRNCDFGDEQCKARAMQQLGNISLDGELGVEAYDMAFPSQPDYTNFDEEYILTATKPYLMNNAVFGVVPKGASRMIQFLTSEASDFMTAEGEKGTRAAIEVYRGLSANPALAARLGKSYNLGENLNNAMVYLESHIDSLGINSEVLRKNFREIQQHGKLEESADTAWIGRQTNNVVNGWRQESKVHEDVKAAVDGTDFFFKQDVAPLSAELKSNFVDRLSERMKLHAVSKFDEKIEAESLSIWESIKSTLTPSEFGYTDGVLKAQETESNVLYTYMKPGLSPEDHYQDIWHRGFRDVVEKRIEEIAKNSLRADGDPLKAGLDIRMFRNSPNLREKSTWHLYALNQHGSPVTVIPDDFMGVDPANFDLDKLANEFRAKEAERLRKLQAEELMGIPTSQLTGIGKQLKKGRDIAKGAAGAVKSVGEAFSDTLDGMKRALTATPMTPHRTGEREGPQQ